MKIARKPEIIGSISNVYIINHRERDLLKTGCLSTLFKIRVDRMPYFHMLIWIVNDNCTLQIIACIYQRIKSIFLFNHKSKLINTFSYKFFKYIFHRNNSQLLSLVSINKWFSDIMVGGIDISMNPQHFINKFLV